jgi:hypothetical protein
MFAFVIPFKPYINSKNWRLDSDYLKSTIFSMLRQTDTDFCIYVIIHDMPIEPIIHHQVKYINIPMPYATFNDITDGEVYLRANTYYSKKDIEYLFDQGRKQMFGANIAKDNGYSYVMCVDGDDIVRENIVEFVKKNQLDSEPGWFVNKGYFHIVEENIFMRQPSSMNMLNGSTYIINARLIPSFDLKNISALSCDFFANHPYLQMRITHLYGLSIKPLPFYATVVQVTSQNWWKTTSNIKGVNLRQKIKYLIRRVHFKNVILKKFGIIPNKFKNN